MNEYDKLKEEITRLEKICIKNNIAYKRTANKKQGIKTMNEYEIEYTLSNGMWNHGRYFGKNKTDAISNFIKWSLRPKSSITSIEKI